MRLTKLVVIAIGVAAVFAGCGGASEEDKKAAVDARALAERNAKRAEEARTVADACQAQLKGYISVLSETNSRLDVGMSFADYGDQVGDISVAYDRIPIGQMEQDCLFGPGVTSEKAGQAYTDAYNVWNDCISDFGCDIDTIDPELQSEWLRASTKLAQAKQALNALRTEADEAEKAAESQSRVADEAEAALE